MGSASRSRTICKSERTSNDRQMPRGDRHEGHDQQLLSATPGSVPCGDDRRPRPHQGTTAPTSPLGVRRGHRVASRQRPSPAGARTGAAITIEVRLSGETVFLHAMQVRHRPTPTGRAASATSSNGCTARRYAVGLEADGDGRSVLELMGLPDRDVACHGGSFPIVVDGVGCIGAVTCRDCPSGWTTNSSSRRSPRSVTSTSTTTFYA